MVQDKGDKEEKAIDVNKMIDGYVEKAHVALDEWPILIKKADKICEAIASAGEQNSYLQKWLLKLVVE